MYLLREKSYHSKENKVSVRNTKGGTLYFIQGTNIWKNPISYLSILEPECGNYLRDMYQHVHLN